MFGIIKEVELFYAEVVLWHVASCSDVRYQLSGGPCCLQVKGIYRLGVGRSGF